MSLIRSDDPRELAPENSDSSEGEFFCQQRGFSLRNRSEDGETDTPQSRCGIVQTTGDGADVTFFGGLPEQKHCRIKITPPAAGIQFRQPACCLQVGLSSVTGAATRG